MTEVDKVLLPMTGKVKKENEQLSACASNQKGGCNAIFGQRKGNMGSTATAQWMGNYSNGEYENPTQEAVRKTFFNPKDSW